MSSNKTGLKFLSYQKETNIMPIYQPIGYQKTRKSRASMASSDSAIDIENNHEEETKKVTTRKGGGWYSAKFLIFVEVTERFAFFGLLGNLFLYLTNVLGESTPTAAKNVSTLIGVCAILPLFGAYIADCFLGRFKTIFLACVIYVLGTSLLTIAVTVIPLHYRAVVFFIALYTIAVAEGGHKPCVLTFAADQFDESHIEEKKAKSSFFNWWFLGITAGKAIAKFVVVYAQDTVGWAAGYGMMTGAMALSLAFFLMGIRRYRMQGPLGSPLTQLAQVFVAAARKWGASITDHTSSICPDEKVGIDGNNQLAHTNQFRFLDKATFIDTKDAARKPRNPWRLCSQNQVEEVKLVLRLIPIWLTCLAFAMVPAQYSTFFLKQGTTMVRSIGPHFKIPPATLQSVVDIVTLIAIPIYDRIFVPTMRRITGHPSGITMLQRIGTGLFLCVIQLIVAALVEIKRVNTARQHDLMDIPSATVPIVIWWLLPQYIIGGISELFTIVGLQELFYDQMPEAMRSVGAAGYTTVIGAGSFINTALIDIMQKISARNGGHWLGDNLNRAHLDYFYYALAVLNALNFCVFVFIARNFVYKKVEGKEIKDGSKLQNDHDHLDAKI